MTQALQESAYFNVGKAKDENSALGISDIKHCLKYGICGFSTDWVNSKLCQHTTNTSKLLTFLK